MDDILGWVFDNNLFNQLPQLTKQLSSLIMCENHPKCATPMSFSCACHQFLFIITTDITDCCAWISRISVVAESNCNLSWCLLWILIILIRGMLFTVCSSFPSYRILSTLVYLNAHNAVPFQFHFGFLVSFKPIYYSDLTSASLLQPWS
jgi:hypothetical protein